MDQPAIGEHETEAVDDLADVARVLVQCAASGDL